MKVDKDIHSTNLLDRAKRALEATMVYIGPGIDADTLKALGADIAAKIDAIIEDLN